MPAQGEVKRVYLTKIRFMLPPLHVRSLNEESIFGSKCPCFNLLQADSDKMPCRSKNLFERVLGSRLLAAKTLILVFYMGDKS